MPKRRNAERETRRGPQSRLLADEVFLASPGPGNGELAAAVCYPHSYRVGMASLGYQLVWGMFAAHGAFRAERFFAGYADRVPAGFVAEPRGLEYGTPLARADVIAFSVYYEPDFLRVCGMLQGGGVRPWAAERGEFDPYVLLGGPAVTANPEPLAPFADAVILGDAEESLPRVLDALAGAAGAPRADVHRLLADVAGVYVPSLYHPVYGAGGEARTVVPAPGAPAAAAASVLADLTPYRGGSWIATPHAEFGKLALLEPLRGCARRCGFCETPVISSPVRRRALASLLALVDEAAPRVKKVGLVGAAVADYDDVEALAAAVLDRRMRLTASSLALAARGTPALIRAIGASGQRSITLAPEAATAAMRTRLGKPLAEGRLEECLGTAADAGVTRVKLYYIIGIPDETDDDVAAIGAQLAALNNEFRRLSLEAHVNPLVPKRRTAFADAPLAAARVYREKLRRIRSLARGARVAGGSWREAALQAKLGRGDRATARWVEWAAAEKDSRRLPPSVSP